MKHAAMWDGDDLRTALRFATEALQRETEAIDALNVYPVPDGDTGTNMSLTMRSASTEAEALGATSLRVADVMRAFARGALLGARGNSGVILSQVFRGFAEALSDVERMDGRDLARALNQAATTAYRAVMKPVEGTMLTVVRVAAEAAVDRAKQEPGVAGVLQAALRGGEEALANTPNQLAVLRQAGVVDSGGQGIVVALSAMLAYAEGAVYQIRAASAAPDLSGLALAESDHDDFGYCTNFMVSGEAIPFTAARDAIAAMGQSAVIVGDQTLLKVHIHTERPGLVLDMAMTWGDLSQIKIDNMDHQVLVRTSEPESSPVPVHGGIAVVAVGNGDGVRAALRSLGATIVLDGGHTMNPSINEILAGIASAPGNEVIVLPNNGNVVMAARSAAELSPKRVQVVPTRSIPAGLAALSSIRPSAGFDQAVQGMERAVERTVAIEVARADRSAEIDGVAATKGAWIALLNDRLVACAANIDDLLSKVAGAIGDTVDVSFATVLTGEGVASDLIESTEAALLAAWPGLELDIIDGDQPNYAFLIGME